MKYGNFYDLESLTLLNRHEGCACSIKECDVEKVNRLISRMREDRERVGLPTAGDVVTYITRGGDYYPQAHIERGDDREVHICLCLLYTSPSPRDKRQSRMPSSA